MTKYMLVLIGYVFISQNALGILPEDGNAEKKSATTSRPSSSYSNLSTEQLENIARQEEAKARIAVAKATQKKVAEEQQRQLQAEQRAATINGLQLLIGMTQEEAETRYDTFTLFGGGQNNGNDIFPSIASALFIELCGKK